MAKNVIIKIEYYAERFRKRHFFEKTVSITNLHTKNTFSCYILNYSKNQVEVFRDQEIISPKQERTEHNEKNYIGFNLRGASDGLRGERRELRLADLFLEYIFGELLHDKLRAF